MKKKTAFWLGFGIVGIVAWCGSVAAMWFGGIVGIKLFFTFWIALQIGKAARVAVEIAKDIED